MKLRDAVFLVLAFLGAPARAADVGRPAVPPAPLPPSLDALCLQPLGAVPATDLDAIRRALERTFLTGTRTLPRMELPAVAYTAARKRYRADQLLDVLRTRVPAGCRRVLGVTAADISTTKGAHADWGVLGLGDLPGSVAVVSSFRAGITARDRGHARVRLGKVAAHEIGHTFGLPHCPHAGCLMRDAGGRVATIDAERGFCEACRHALAAAATAWRDEARWPPSADVPVRNSSGSATGTARGAYGTEGADARLVAHADLLRQRLAAHGLALDVRIEPPFVVAGDDPPALLERRLATIRWATGHLEASLFARRPARVLDVFLFRDAASYERGVKELTHERPGTPYGFYSEKHGGLFMNIGTGGGTLVHEIVHPYVEADFPRAPPWLNEGLGSLYEHSAERGGRIVGLPNWRLPGLQRAIRRGHAPALRDLCAQGERAFYEDRSGVYYAASRYLLYYLQERGLLQRFYRAFRAGRAADPTGYATLATTLGERDMAAFEKRWRSFVLALRER